MKFFKPFSTSFILLLLSFPVKTEKISKIRIPKMNFQKMKNFFKQNFQYLEFGKEQNWKRTEIGKEQNFQINEKMIEFISLYFHLHFAIYCDETRKSYLYDML